LKRTLELLLEAGADINARDASERTPVFVSIVRGGPEVVDYLASRGADLQVRSNQGLSLLHEAARTTQFVAGEDRIPLVAYLLDQGLEVDARDERGMTPLHIAAFWANQPLLRFLIERGAEVDARAKAGGNAVYFACQATDPPASDRLETVQFLIEQEVAVDVVGVDGHTPLHMAAWFGHDDLVTLLVERGLDPAEENDEGKTPADLAAEGGFAALAEQLRARTSMDGAAGDEGGGAEGAGSG
jgi:ankyrin repeat protein